MGRFPQGGAGGGSITDITSTGGSLVITNPTGPTTNLETAAAAVTSVFGRTGNVVATTGDYTAAQVGALPSTDDLSTIATTNPTVASWSNNSRKITALANGSVSTDAAAFGQIPTSASTIGGLLAANNLTDVADRGSSRFNLGVPTLSAVAAASTTNVNLSAPGATMDGYTFLTNDEFLVTGQSTASQNGVWTWNGASSAATRPHEFPSGGLVQRGRLVQVVNGGVNANSIWCLNSTAAGITIDTTAQTWAAVSIIGTAANESIIRANTLDQFGAPAATVSFNSQRLSNLHTPTATTDAGTALNALLAATYYEPGSLVTPTTTSTTLVAVDTTNLTISLTAISTVVVIQLEAYVTYSAGTTQGAIFWALFTHSTTTQVGYTVAPCQLATNTTPAYATTRTIRVTGLTAGTAYQWDWAWAVANAADTATMVFRATTGVTGGTFGPGVMRAFAG